MDSKENKLYHFIQLELLRLKNLTKLFGKSNLQGIKGYFYRTESSGELFDLICGRNVQIMCGVEIEPLRNAIYTTSCPIRQ